MIITATGLKLRLAGGIRVSVDGQAVDFSKKFLWKGFMLQDLPNLALVLGYVNASWTLGAEVTGKAVVRILHQIKRECALSATPRLEHPERMQPRPLFQISATYVRDADSKFPQGGTGPWAHRWNYLPDYWKSVWGDIKTGLEYS
jgi:cation diffusion facilitator CzcD-associated flavoprotein CzcO